MFLSHWAVSVFSDAEACSSPAWWSTGQLLRSPLALAVGFIIASCQAAIGFLDVALALHLHQIKVGLPYSHFPTQLCASSVVSLQPGLSSVYVGLIFLIPAGIVVFLAPAYGILADKYKVGLSCVPHHECLWNPMYVHRYWLDLPYYLEVLWLSLVSWGWDPHHCCPSSPSEYSSLDSYPYLAVCHSFFLHRGKLWVVMVSLAVAGVGWGATVLTYEQLVIAARNQCMPDDLHTRGIVSGLNNSFNSLGWALKHFLCLTPVLHILPIAGRFLDPWSVESWLTTLVSTGQPLW